MICFCGESITSYVKKKLSSVLCLGVSIASFTPPPHRELDLKKKDWSRLLNCPHSPCPPTSFFGPLQHPVNPPDSCQWPAIATKPPNTHRWGKKQPFRNLLEYVPNTKTSLATVKDFNSFTERIKGARVGCVLTWHCRKAERRSDFVRGTRLDPLIYSEAPQTSLPLKALPYWHLTFLTQGQKKWHFFPLSGLFVCFCFFLFLFSEFPPNLKKAAFKRHTVQTLYGLQTLYLKWKWTWNVEMKSTF